VSPTTAEKRAASLEVANEVRTARAELKVEMAAGVRTLAEILRADEDFIQTMKVRDLLAAVPTLGPVHIHRALVACRISPTAPVRMFNQARREELIAWIARNRKAAPIEPEIERELWGGKGGYR
jgi:hypothetical protein